jgi:hypothetical protein
MTNSDSGSELAEEILLTIGAIYEWPDFGPTEKIVADIDPAIYQQATGRYEFTGAGVVTIELVDGELWVEAPGGERSEILPESATVFFLRDNGRTITFVREEDQVVAFIYSGTRADRIE